MADTKTADRVVRHLSTAYFVPFTGADGNKTVLVRTARRGDVIDTSSIADGEIARLEGLGALLPAGAKPGDEQSEQDAILDLYRGQRGDTEALTRAMRRAGSQPLQDTTGGIVDVSGGNSNPTPVGNVGNLADKITGEKLTIDDTVALAGDDPELARRVLEAERLASGGSPRAGVESKLQKIIDG